jgi:hypothetical protein
MNDAAGLEPDCDPPEQYSVADHASGKTRLLARQCQTCIFRPGDLMHLGPGRLRDIVSEALTTGRYIVCHDTLPAVNLHSRPAICRGFYDRYTTQALQIISRLWGFLEVEPPATEVPQ